MCHKFNILCTCCYDLIFPSAQEHGVGMDGKHSVLICLNPTQTLTSVGQCMLLILIPFQMHRFKDHQQRVGCVRAAVADTQINRWRWCDRTLKLSFSLLLGDMLWSLCKIMSHLRSVALKMWNLILLQVGHAGIRLLFLLREDMTLPTWCNLKHPWIFLWASEKWF